MYLKLLEIQGFKSFPDKTQLEFGRGIAAVVGPNGSGKSNISDAIRWVLGEVSSKALRGTRMEDVIFGGTVNRRALGFAEVSITMDNSGRELALDADEVKVSRRYYRSGESEYLLCGKSVRLRDIHELFMDTGLGPDGYSVIGQGRIDEIVSARSEDRREIFEEAAGIAKYRMRKEESQRRLAATEENLVRLRDILSELEERVGPLKEQAEKAREYIDLASEKKKLEVGLWLGDLGKKRVSLREHENRIAYVKAQYGDTEGKLNSAEKELEEIYMEAQRAAAEIDGSRDEAGALEAAAVKKQAEADVLENDIKHNRENIARVETEIEEIEKSGGDHEQEMTRLNAELEGKKKKAAELQETLVQCQRELETVLEKSRGFAEKQQKSAQKVTEFSLKLADLRVEKNSALTSLNHQKEREEQIRRELESGRLSAESANKKLEQCSALIQEYGNKISGLQNGLEGYGLKLDARRERFSRIDETIRSFTLQYQGKMQRAKMLQDMEQSLEGFSHAVKAVMKEHGRGTLAGVLGPVSRLITVPAEYAVAVETALGASAQHIVVEDENTAKSAIAMLKRTAAGRATFMPVTSVSGRRLETRGAERMDGYIGIAGDLVSYHPRLDGIVKNLLGRTVIASDLDRATEIARRHGYSFRVVTLDGQVVNAGGSFTGGSAARGAGLLSRASEIEALKKSADEIKSQINAKNDEKKAVTESMSQIQAAISGARGEMQTAREEKIRCEEEQKRTEEALNAFRRRQASAIAETSQSQEKISGYKALIAAADQKINEISQEIEQAQTEAEILSGGGRQLVKLRENLNEKITATKLEMLACGMDIEAQERAIGEAGQKHRDRQERINGLKTRAEDYRALCDAAGIEIDRRLEEKTKMQDDAAKARERAEQLSGKRDMLEQETQGRRVRERELNEEKEGLSKELARLEERRAGLSADYDAIIAKLYDEYELTRTEAEGIAVKIDDPGAAQIALSKIKAHIKALGAVNVGAIEEYKQVNERYRFMKTQTDDVEKSKKELDDLIHGLTKQMQDIFSKKFSEINSHFKETFVELFGGGEGSLNLTDPEDVLNSGIEISVQPPGKIIRNLSALSGGEKAFVAIAIYFAILKVRPSPFCVLDEIEAALDDANVSRYAAYLRKMCGNTQFIVITHRRGSMEEADVLFGVTMQDEGVSKLLTLKLDELEQKLGMKA